MLIRLLEQLKTPGSITGGISSSIYGVLGDVTVLASTIDFTALLQVALVGFVGSLVGALGQQLVKFFFAKLGSNKEDE